ncbi:hypothetical protein ACWELQ_26835, partial [Nocardia sp. NPDC004722]
MRRRLGSLAVAGALPLVAALATAGTSAAEPVSSDENQPAVVDNQPAATQPGGTDAGQGMVVDTPFGKFAVPMPQAMADKAHAYLDATAAEVQPADATDTVEADPLVPAGPVAPVRVGRNSATGVRDIPNSALAPVDQSKLHQPDPMSAPEVAPIAAPEAAACDRCDPPPYLQAAALWGMGIVEFQDGSH